MEANNFVAKLKANGTDKDLHDLIKVYDEYKVILCNLEPKDKGPFSLNVLCIICRNLDKVPSWRDRVDSKVLLTLSIDCVRETRMLLKGDQVKTLACVYHIHKHVVKLNTTLPPELMLKLSFMPFEYDSSLLLSDYCKTYWNILADRMTYIEKLKAKHSIIKLLPRLIEDIVKVVKMYDTVQFCTNILTFLVKKLHFLYNDSNGKELHKCFGVIFKEIQLKMDGEAFDGINEKEALDLYVKFNDCFYVIAENASRNSFKDCVLETVISTAAIMLRHNVELSECLNTFYLNGFCKIFDSINNIANNETILNKILESCIKFDKNVYDKAVKATCPYLNQFVRLFIEFNVSNEKRWKEFSIQMQHSCLNIIFYLSTKKADQLLKCDNCKVKSSLHDSLRLLFLIKHFPSLSINNGVDITPILPIYYKLVTLQHKILYELRTLGCANFEKCFRKLQTDIHNTAILLNKAQYYENSIKLFNMYVEFEIKYFKAESDLKNICRALYNKSICELDHKLYDDALKDAFLSLVFSLPDGLGTEKYMSLVMDVKAKELKSNDDVDSHDIFQLCSVVEACKMLFEEKKYGNLKPFLSHLKFTELLKHEFYMYSKLWPSIVPVAGVWRSLRDLLRKKHVSWVEAEPVNQILSTLHEVVLETPSVVRTIHSEYFSEIVTELLQTDDISDSPDQEYIQASLLFLKAEYDMTEASLKYGWKFTPTMDPDQGDSVRTFPQEHAAVGRAIEAVKILTSAVQSINTVPVCGTLKSCLRLSEVWAVQLVHLGRLVEGLQLTHMCLQVATHVSDALAYIRSASILLSHADRPSAQLTGVVSRAVGLWGGLGAECGEDALVFLCCAAIYYNKCGSRGVAARLLHLVQGKLLAAYENNPEVNLEMAVGRLMEAQNELCRGSHGGALSAVSNAQRHYLAVPNTATKWVTRRHLSLRVRLRAAAAGARCVRVCRALQLRRRARAAAAAACSAGAARAHAHLYALITHTHMTQEAQTRIDNRLKHILGLQPSNEPQQHRSDPQTKQALLTPRLEQLETMLENVVFKRTETSPSLPCTSVFAYKMPDFFRHSTCNCYACANPYTLILSCLTSGLEASTYFRAKEMDIARNYFEGTMKSFGYAEVNLKAYFRNCKSKFEEYIVDMVEGSFVSDFKEVQIEIFIEAAFFELAQNLYERADDLIVRIHELMQDMNDVDPYLKNEVMNLMTTAAQLRKIVKKPVETGLEVEMESLKLTPQEEPKTPVVKPKNPPKLTKVVVKNEELPNVKRKVIKLNLDDVSEEQEVTKPVRKRAEFKIPVPVTSKPVIESITPRTRSKPKNLVSKPDISVSKPDKTVSKPDKSVSKPDKSVSKPDKLVTKPDIFVSKPSEDVKMTPKTEFFTPISTPADQFFTPMTTMKTYSKKSLMSNIVKNLEAEFSTPTADKENSTLKTDVDRLELPKGSVRATRSKVADKRTLKRVTSPGKLVKDVKTTRSRLRNPANFNIHEDK